MNLEKLPWKEWLDTYFEQPYDSNYFISKYEHCDLGFAWSDLSHYTLAELEVEYQKYLTNTNDFLQYEE